MENRTTAELIVIGSEILLGESLDTNTRVIALALREEGISLARVATVGDRHEDIVAAMRQAAARAGAVIATGGLGPTVDDPTRAAAAEAAGVELVFEPALWEAIGERMARIKRRVTENNRRQAYIPSGAEPLPNPFGTAPGFAVAIGDSLLCALPGVPAEMQPMLMDQALPRIRARLGLRQVLRTRTLLATGLTESQIDASIGSYEEKENPVVGLAAYPGMTRIRITARGPEDTATRALLDRTEAEIRGLLGRNVFGVDDDTLAGAALRAMPAGATLASWEAGTCGSLSALLSAEPGPSYSGGLVLGEDPAGSLEIGGRLAEWMASRKASHGAAAMLIRREGRFLAQAAVCIAGRTFQTERILASPHEVAVQWAAAAALSFLREHLPPEADG